MINWNDLSDKEKIRKMEEGQHEFEIILSEILEPKEDEDGLINITDWLCDIVGLFEAKDKEIEELKKWSPIISRLIDKFGSFERAKSIDNETYCLNIFEEIEELKSENKQLKRKIKDCPMCELRAKGKEE